MPNKSRNTISVRSAPTTTEGPLQPRDLASLGIEPMSARSIMLSALLGTHPPKLPGRSLVALAELFGVRPGTARTSLSRMVANGELQSDDGWYGLTDRLRERQRQQDTGRARPTTVRVADDVVERATRADDGAGAEGGPGDDGWNGDWVTAIAANDRRSMAERRAFREQMVGARLAELRPDIWMRPANVPTPVGSGDVITTVGPLGGHDVDDLVSRLWPLDEIEHAARRLADALDRQRTAIDDGDVSHLPQTFMVAAAVVRFLRTEPQLPSRLAPSTWTADELRLRYDDFDEAFLGQLRAFFASVR